MSSPILRNLAVVLVEPRSPGNIGMVCRAMANFGMTDLRLVRPCPHLHPEAHKFAVFAADLLGSARLYADLPSALEDLHLTVATTRRRGRLRGEPISASAVPGLLRPLPPGTRSGIVFGREDSGLTSEEVSLCSHTAFIPSLPDKGSLNLAQAVLILLYECFKYFQDESALPEKSEEYPAHGQIEPLFVEMERVLSRIAFLNPLRPEGQMARLRQIFQRANLTCADLALLRGMWSQIAWSIRDWRGRKRGEN